MKILLVEDEPSLAASIRDYLRADGNVCECAANLREARERAAMHEYDCLLVDIGLPDGNGLDLVRQLKTEHSAAGIIIISAKNSLDDRVTGLDLGADDYLTKPFHLAELNARLRALVRRRQFGGEAEIEFREIRVLPEQKRVTVAEREVVLTRSEYELLLYLLANQRRVLTKESVAEHLSGDHADLMDNFNFIYSHVKNLRKKLVDAGARDYIQSVYGVGYKWAEL